MEILPNDISQILRDLYSFYPIGSEIANKDYEGYKGLQQIVAAKINSIIEEGTDTICPGLKDSLSTNLPHCKIVTEYEKQFPNYAISIFLGSHDTSDENISTTIKIRISLLTKFYTYFYEQLSIHKKVSNSPVHFRPLRKITVSPKPFSLESNDNTLVLIRDIVDAFLKSYRFISADLLLNHKIRFGSPIGFEIAGIRKEFSLYDFLFDHEYCHPIDLTLKT